MLNHLPRYRQIIGACFIGGERVASDLHAVVGRFHRTIEDCVLQRIGTEELENGVLETVDVFTRKGPQIERAHVEVNEFEFVDDDLEQFHPVGKGGRPQNEDSPTFKRDRLAHTLQLSAVSVRELQGVNRERLLGITFDVRLGVDSFREDAARREIGVAHYVTQTIADPFHELTREEKGSRKISILLGKEAIEEGIVIRAANETKNDIGHATGGIESVNGVTVLAHLDGGKFVRELQGGVISITEIREDSARDYDGIVTSKRDDIHNWIWLRVRLGC